MTSQWKIQHVPKQMAVFTTILDNHVEFNKYLKQVILEHRQKYPDDVESNVKAWHSAWDTHTINPKFQPVVDLTVNALEFITGGYYSEPVQYYVLNLWAMMYEDTEWTKRHSHFPSDFAACYYVDVEPNCAPVIFESVVEDGTHDNNQPLTLQPQNGMLAIWPALLHHEVPPTKGRRMCISMNIEKGVTWQHAALKTIPLRK
tara:strand:+ start:851 stop:1456 length:606 start_codon:yes stop_codon:yes gene_type:complete